MAQTRITSNTVARQVFNNLQKNLGAMQKLQEQMSSQKLINRPSDSPTGTVASLRLRSNIDRIDQYSRNVDDGFGWLGLADTALQGVSDQMIRARDLVLQAKSGASGPADRAAIAAEIKTIRDGLLELANSKYLDRPIFAGTSGAASAYDADGVYLGDGGAVDRNVAPGVTVTVNISAETTFGAGASSIFGVLDTVINNLTSDPSALDADLTAIDANMTQLGNSLAEVGARYRRLEVLKDRTQITQLDLKKSLTEVEDVDIAKAILDLQLQENAYQAALGATARVIQPSLVDFLS